MKKILTLFSLLFIFFPSLVRADSEASRIYLIEVFYTKGILSLGEVSTKIGYVPPAERESREIPCRIRILSFTGKILEEQTFSLSPYVYYDPPREGEDYSGPTGQTELDKTEILAILPYHNDGKWVELSNANGKILERKDIGYLARVCGDGVCQEHESFADCSEDCDAAGADDYCNFDKFEEDVDCAGEKPQTDIVIADRGAKAGDIFYSDKSNFLKFIFLGIVSIIVIIFSFAIYFFLKKKSKDNL